MEAELMGIVQNDRLGDDVPRLLISISRLSDGPEESYVGPPHISPKRLKFYPPYREIPS